MLEVHIVYASIEQALRGAWKLPGKLYMPFLYTAGSILRSTRCKIILLNWMMSLNQPFLCAYAHSS